MTTKKYDTLSERAGKLCVGYVECMRKIEEYTIDLMNGRLDSVILLSTARQRRDGILEQLAQLENIAIDTLSNSEYARYFRYVSVMLSPLTEH